MIAPFYIVIGVRVATIVMCSRAGLRVLADPSWSRAAVAVGLFALLVLFDRRVLLPIAVRHESTRSGS